MSSQQKQSLVVADGDRSNRRLLCAALRNAGYEPIEASSAGELASHLSVLAVAGLKVSAVIVDVQMPGLEQVDIQAPLIAMVSFAGGNTDQQLDALRPAAVIHRPIFVDEVQEAVKHLTSRPAAPGGWRDHHRRRKTPINIHHTLTTLDNPRGILSTWS